MATAIFDTHAFIKRLTAAGMPEAQAEILAEEFLRRHSERLAVQPKHALASGTEAMGERIVDQLTIRVGGMLVVFVVLVAALIRLF